MQKLAQFLRDRLDLIVLLSFLMLTYFVWSYGIKNDKTDQAFVEDATHNMQVIVTEEAENIFAFIDGVRGLYVASGDVTDKELSSYMSATSQNHLSEAVLRINYIAKVKNEDIVDRSLIVPGYDDQYIAQQMVDKAGQIYDPGDYNVILEPSRRLVIDSLIAGKMTGIISVSEIQNVDEYSGRGFIFVVPIYKEDELVGFVDAFVSGEKLQSIVEELIDKDWGYRWSQGEELIASVELPSEVNVISSKTTIEIGEDDVWNIELFKVRAVNMLWTLVLASGVVLSFLVYIVVYALNSASLRGLEVGRAMNKDLQKYKLALDSASNHIVITDADGKILYANKAAIALTGYDKQEILGQTPRLWGGLMGKPFYVRFWDQIKNKRTVYSGIFENKRKNGETYLAQATVSPILDEKGELLGFVGVEEDVTEERRIQKENKESLAKLAKFNELMVGRELKMVELKKTIANLKGGNEK